MTHSERVMTQRDFVVKNEAELNSHMLGQTDIGEPDMT